MTNPSRSLSKGRLAPSGSSLRVDNAFIALNPPSPRGVVAASVPPATTASCLPSRIRWNASPSALLPEAHAEVGVQLTPFRP